MDQHVIFFYYLWYAGTGTGTALFRENFAFASGFLSTGARHSVVLRYGNYDPRLQKLWAREFGRGFPTPTDRIGKIIRGLVRMRLRHAR